MISKKIKIFWVGPLIPAKSMNNWVAASPAAMKWQKHLIETLQSGKINIEWIYYRPDRYWPLGRLMPFQAKFESKFGFKNTQIKYINFPFLRNFTSEICLKYILKSKYKLNESNFTILISYNAPKWINNIFLDKKVRSKFILIYFVADNKVPTGADGYIFLSYYFFKKFNLSKNKLHFDGAVYSKKKIKIKKLNKKKSIIFLYAGSFHKWGGAKMLLDAIKYIKNNDFELWFCGPGNGEIFKFAAKNDQRIKYFGLVSAKKLNQLYNKADVFLNPRPLKMPGNELNFPSKLLDYLAWKKPIISTWSKSLSNKYRKILDISRDNPKSFALVMKKYILSKKISLKIKKNNTTNKSWIYESKKVISFLEKTILSKQ